MSGQYKVIQTSRGGLDIALIIDADGFYINENNTLVLFQELDPELELNTVEDLKQKGPRRMANVAAFRVDQWSQVYDAYAEMEN